MQSSKDALHNSQSSEHHQQSDGDFLEEFDGIIADLYDRIAALFYSQTATIQTHILRKEIQRIADIFVAKLLEADRSGLRKQDRKYLEDLRDFTLTEIERKIQLLTHTTDIQNSEEFNDEEIIPGTIIIAPTRRAKRSFRQ